jgi:hypothetical protein
MARRWLSAERMAGNRTAVGDWVATAWPGDGRPVQPVLGQAPALVVDLSVMRRYGPAAYRWLLRHSRAAASIAGKMGWGDAEPRRDAPGEEEQAAVAGMVDAIVRRVASATVPQGAPRPPDPAHQAAVSRYAAQVGLRGRGLGELSREQLEAVWQAAGAQRPGPREGPT